MLRYDPAKDAYAILGVHPEATQKDVERAFRRAVLTWHPDKSPAPDATERFFEVQEAGRILRDPVSRSDYDRVRLWHLGPAARPRRRQAASPERPPEPYRPLDPPPGWLADKVKVNLDKVTLRVNLPNASPASGLVAWGLAVACLLTAIGMKNILIGALAVVLWLYGRVVATPPHKGRLVWAEMTPGRQFASAGRQPVQGPDHRLPPGGGPGPAPHLRSHRSRKVRPRSPLLAPPPRRLNCLLPPHLLRGRPRVSCYFIDTYVVRSRIPMPQSGMAIGSQPAARGLRWAVGESAKPAATRTSRQSTCASPIQRFNTSMRPSLSSITAQWMRSKKRPSSPHT